MSTDQVSDTFQLQQILSMIPTPQGSLSTPNSYGIAQDPYGLPPNRIFQNSTSPASAFGTGSGTSPSVPHTTSSFPHKSPSNFASGRLSGKGKQKEEAKDWPKLPGFAPPVSVTHLHVVGIDL
jgi:hypothetical protein